MAKQDWSPRLMDLPPLDRLKKLDGLAWWDAMTELRQKMTPAVFHHWILRVARPWPVRAKIIMMMAWNDHNSSWNLDRDILRTHRFSDDGTKVTAEIVAESLESMLD